MTARLGARRWPFVVLDFADAGYAGTRVAGASPIRIEIVRKPRGQSAYRLPALAEASPSMPADGW
jgi:putative transposase